MDDDNYDNQSLRNQDDIDQVEQVDGYSDSPSSQGSGLNDGSEKGSGEDEQLQEQDMQSLSEDDDDQRHKIIDENDVNQFQEPNPERITSPYMTKYEKARIIGVRAVQISKNAPVYVQVNQNIGQSALSIAQRELAQKKIPFIIRRYLPDGSFQHWKVSELKTFD